MDYEVGSVSSGTVTRIAPYGAFITLEGGGFGLVHISEVSDGFVRDINECLTVGDKVNVKIIGVDEKGKLSLSVRQAAQPKRRSAPPVFESKTESGGDFEDMMSRFLSAGNEKLADLKARGDIQPKKRRREQ